MEPLEKLKEIENNQPEDGTATNIDDDGDYIRYRNGMVEYYFPADGWLEVEWCDFRVMRSLSDIKLIIELMEDKKKAWKAYVALEEIKQKYNGENKIAKALLKLAYECDEFALPSDLRKDIKNFIGDL